MLFGHVIARVSSKQSRPSITIQLESIRVREIRLELQSDEAAAFSTTHLRFHMLLALQVRSLSQLIGASCNTFGSFFD
jgi:hypothetical protein